MVDPPPCSGLSNDKIPTDYYGKLTKMRKSAESIHGRFGNLIGAVIAFLLAVGGGLSFQIGSAVYLGIPALWLLSALNLRPHLGKASLSGPAEPTLHQPDKGPGTGPNASSLGRINPPGACISRSECLS